MACPWQTGTRGHLPHRQLSPSSNSSEIQVHIRAVHPPSHGQWGKVGGRHLCTDRHRSEVGNGWADPHPHCNWRNWLLRTSTEFSKRNQSLAVNIRGCLLPTINKVISFSPWAGLSVAFCASWLRRATWGKRLQFLSWVSVSKSETLKVAPYFWAWGWGDESPPWAQNSTRGA